jgi:hypothetical protein
MMVMPRYVRTVHTSGQEQRKHRWGDAGGWLPLVTVPILVISGKDISLVLLMYILLRGTWCDLPELRR